MEILDVKRKVGETHEKKNDEKKVSDLMLLGLGLMARVGVS